MTVICGVLMRWPQCELLFFVAGQTSRSLFVPLQHDDGRGDPATEGVRFKKEPPTHTFFLPTSHACSSAPTHPPRRCTLLPRPLIIQRPALCLSSLLLSPPATASQPPTRGQPLVMCLDKPPTRHDLDAIILPEASTRWRAPASARAPAAGKAGGALGP